MFIFALFLATAFWADDAYARPSQHHVEFDLSLLVLTRRLCLSPPGQPAPQPSASRPCTSSSPHPLRLS